MVLFFLFMLQYEYYLQKGYNFYVFILYRNGIKGCIDK